jgi:hypothetical protein
MWEGSHPKKNLFDKRRSKKELTPTLVIYTLRRADEQGEERKKNTKSDEL